MKFCLVPQEIFITRRKFSLWVIFFCRLRKFSLESNVFVSGINFSGICPPNPFFWSRGQFFRNLAKISLLGVLHPLFRNLDLDAHFSLILLLDLTPQHRTGPPQVPLGGNISLLRVLHPGIPRFPQIFPRLARFSHFCQIPLME